MAILGFGEQQAGYNIPVLNEREVRAAAGILLVLGLIAFMHAWLVGDFYWTRLMVTGFLIDFIIRVLINPRYAPSMILGRFIVRHQAPDYVGAPQKRFAWAIGLVLALIMFYLVVLNQVVGPINILVCTTCLILLGFESVFGICLGCKLYQLFQRSVPQYCAGQSCETHTPQSISLAQWLIVASFSGVLFAMSYTLLKPTVMSAPATPTTQAHPTKDCTPPDWAVKMGHAEKWKLHNGC